MYVLRILVVLLAIAIGSGIVAFLFTGERRYLSLSWRITRYALLFAFVLLCLLALERVLAMV